MGIFKRPTMGDRMDNATERSRPWWATAQIREVGRDAHRRFKVAEHGYENSEPYRGSRTEASHRRGRKK